MADELDTDELPPPADRELLPTAALPAATSPDAALTLAADSTLVAAATPSARPLDESMPAVEPLPPGDFRLPGYEALGELGRGGMGSVLLARDLRVGRLVAIKTLHDDLRHDPAAVRRFRCEARVCGQLQHPNIVPVHELGAFADGRPYFAMKHVVGRSLAEMLRAAPNLAARRTLVGSVFLPVCQAIASAHQRGIVHRDLKPANVMVGAFGEVLVMDWGLAKDLRATADPDTEAAAETSSAESPHTQFGSVIGTAAYMPPEQAQGRHPAIDARSDVFALGAMLCEMLSGKPPYEGKDAWSVVRQAAAGEQTVARARLAAAAADEPELLRLALAALEPDPLRRPVNAGALAEALERQQAQAAQRLRDLEIRRAEDALRELQRQQSRRRRTAVAVGATLTLFGAGFWFMNARSDRMARRAGAAMMAADRLDQAERFEQQAGAAPSDRARQLALARGAVDTARAEALGAADPALNDRIAAAATRLAEQDRAGERGQQLLQRLEAIDRRMTTLWSFNRDTPPDHAGDYRQAFAEFGLDLDRMTAAEIAERCSDSALREAAGGGLATYGWLRQYQGGNGGKFFAAAMRLDPPSGRPSGPPPKSRPAAEGEPRSPIDGIDTSEQAMAFVHRQRVATMPVRAIGLFAEGLAQRGFRPAALELLRAGAIAHPQDLWLLRRAAFHSGIENRWNDAIRYGTAALAAGGTDADLYRDLGRSLAVMGRLSEALVALDAALKLAPDDPHALARRATLLHQLGRRDEAKTLLRQVIAKHPDQHLALHNLYVMLADEDKKRHAPEMLALAEAYCKLRPDHPDAHGVRGEALLGLGRFAEAEKAFAQSAQYAAALTSYPHPAWRYRWEAARLVARAARNGAAPTTPVERADDGLAAWVLDRDSAAALKHFESALAAADAALMPYRSAAAAAAAAAALHSAQSPETERPSRRALARRWLTESLDALRAELRGPDVAARRRAFQLMHSWTLEPAFDPFRVPEQREKLPEPERAAWERFWAEVAALEQPFAPR